MIDRGQFSALVSRGPQQAAEHSCSTLCAECACRVEKMSALLLRIEFFIIDLQWLYARHAALCRSSVFRRNMVRVLLSVCTTDEYEKLLACAVRLEGYLRHTEPIPSSVEKRLVSQWMAVLSWAGALECED
jgi:hypothetical protein